MKTKKRILIAGIGGVGGYIGAMLANFYANCEEIEICFLARGENHTIIKREGIKLITDTEKFVAKPFIVANEVAELGQVDYIICCVKSYGLEEIINQLKSCIHSKTIILPLLNGIDATERIKNIHSNIEIWEGCIYLVSRLDSLGVVLQKGKANSLFFGSENGNKTKLEELNRIFQSAGINAHLTENINQIIWEKYIFISAIASLTSYLNLGIGSILKTEQHKHLLMNLLNEVRSIAEFKQIALSEDTLDTILKKLSGLPPETTSSMQLDFSKGNKTELESLTGKVIEMGKMYKIQTPTYELIYNKLKD